MGEERQRFSRGVPEARMHGTPHITVKSATAYVGCLLGTAWSAVDAAKKTSEVGCCMDAHEFCLMG
jgi:hypothetical protein